MYISVSLVGKLSSQFKMDLVLVSSSLFVPLCLNLHTDPVCSMHVLCLGFVTEWLTDCSDAIFLSDVEVSVGTVALTLRQFLHNCLWQGMIFILPTVTSVTVKSDYTLNCSPLLVSTHDF